MLAMVNLHEESLMNFGNNITTTPEWDVCLKSFHLCHPPQNNKNPQCLTAVVFVFFMDVLVCVEGLRPPCSSGTPTSSQVTIHQQQSCRGRV